MIKRIKMNNYKITSISFLLFISFNLYANIVQIEYVNSSETKINLSYRFVLQGNILPAGTSFTSSSDGKWREIEYQLDTDPVTAPKNWLDSFRNIIDGKDVKSIPFGLVIQLSDGYMTYIHLHSEYVIQKVTFDVAKRAFVGQPVTLTNLSWVFINGIIKRR